MLFIIHYARVLPVVVIGLLSMYALVIMLYLGGISLFAKRVWQSIQKGGPMHEVWSNKII